MTVPPFDPPQDGIPMPPPPPPQSTPPVPPTGGIPPQGPPKNDTALYAMIAGILGITICGFFAGLPAIFLGIAGKKKAAEMGGEGEGQAQAGLVMGWISVILSTIGIIIWVCVVFIFASSGTAIVTRFNHDAAQYQKAADKIAKEANKAQKQIAKQEARNGTVVKTSKYKISNEVVDVQDGGFVDYTAKITNKDDFQTSYEVSVHCSGSQGDDDTESTYVYTVNAGSTKTIEESFYFDSATTQSGTSCDVKEVKYN